MNKTVIKPYDVVTRAELPEILVDQLPADGDPLEIGGELYFVCERNYKDQSEILAIGVIPLVVRNPAKVKDINNYLQCLSVAHRRVQFKKNNETCDPENCDEIIIS